MAISIQQFRQKAGAGDATRLEVNSQGTDLHRKGLSAGGKAVEWLRDAGGLRVGENRKVMHAFVAALKLEYGQDIGDKLAAKLAKGLDGGSKPLSSRTARLVLDAADRLQAGATAHNAVLAKACSAPDSGGRVNGYMGAVLAAKQATGAADHLIAPLFDAGDHKTRALQAQIEAAITAAGQGGQVRVDGATAQAIASQAIEQILRVWQANDQAIDGVLGAGNAEAPFQRLVAQKAADLGAPGLAGLLADAASPGTAGFKAAITGTLSSTQPTAAPLLQQSAEARLERFMIGQAVEGGHLAGMARLPDDPRLALALGKEGIARIFDDRHPELTPQRAALEALLGRELTRLAGGSADEKELARQLSSKLEDHAYQLADPALKLKVLTSARDDRLESARAGGPEKAWSEAAAFQNDIVALHLRGLGASQLAQGRAALEALAARSPELAGAMRDLDRLERDYVTAKGGDPDVAGLDWRSSREQLATLRAAARELAGEAEGNELQGLIAAKMRGLTADMVARAAAVLGPPPAEYAVLSLGSAARGEASPFSDVEFAILLDRPSTPQIEDYFQRLAGIVRFQVANLGEDGGQETPMGFHWDTGGNTPLESPDRFIGSAAQLIEATLGETRDARGPKPAEMFEMTMLLSPEHLHGSQGDARDFALVQDLQRRVGQHLQTASTAAPGLSLGQSFSRWLAREAGEVADLRAAAQADTVDVKKLSRFPMMLVQSLALEHGLTADDAGIAANSTLMRLAALERAGVLSPAEARTLGEAFVTLGRVRIEAHLHAGEASDKVHLDADPADGGFAAPELRQVIQSLLPFLDRAQV